MSISDFNTASKRQKNLETTDDGLHFLLSLLELKTFIFLIFCAVATTVLYVGSTKFTQNIIEEKYNKISQNNIELLVRDLTNMQSMLTMIANTQSTTQHKQFNEIFTLSKTVETQNQWHITNKQPANTNDSVTYQISKHNELLSILNAPQSNKQSPFYILTDPSIFSIKTEKPQKNSQSTYPIALILKTGPTQYWVATTQIKNILSEYWLNNNDITRFSVKDTTNNQLIYDFNITNTENIMFSAAHEFKNADKKWEVTTEFSNNKIAQNLRKLSITCLWVCAALSIIGLLFFSYTAFNKNKAKQANEKLNQKQTALEQEIQKRRILDRELGTSEREKRALIDSVSDIIFETDIKGKILFLNAKWSKITGFPTEQTIGTTLFQMLHPQDQKQQEDDFNLMIQGKKAAYKAFTRIRKSDGSFHAIDLAISMIRQDENKNLRVVGTMTDVEGQERAEKALQEAEKKYRTIVENAAGGIFQMTPEGIFLSANPALARILGYMNSKELIQNVKDANTLYIDQKQRTKMLNELKATSIITNYESQIKSRTGTHIWVNENIRTVRDEEGNIIYFEGSMEDITERKESDFILKEAKMHSDMANRAKSEFLANMSHELRTPLNAIIGFSEIIKDQSFGQIDKTEYVDYATDIYGSGKNLLKIINDILDISKIEANQRVLEEEEFSLGDLIDESLDMLKVKVAENNIIISKQYEDMPTILAEHIALKQIMVNILSNAIKFTPPNGHISIDSTYEENGDLRLSVTDTGIGLNPQDINKVLEPFGQLEDTFSRQHGGTGLGLTLVNALMKLHSGTLDILSQKGIGTTIILHFPSDRILQKNKNTQNQDKENT